MAWPSYFGYTPRYSQYGFHESDSVIKFACGGVGAGKTLMGAMEFLQCALENPGSSGMIVAPTWPLLKRVTLRTFKAICPRELIASENKGDRYIELVNGFRVYYDSTKEPERLEGSNLSVIWHDEARFSPRKAFTILLGRLRDPSAKREAYIITSTPEYGWLYEEFALKTKSSVTDEDHVYRPANEGHPRQWWVIPTKDNHYLPPAFVRTLADTYTSHVYAMYVEGLFAPPEGAVFDQFRESIHLQRLPVVSGHPVNIGHDPGIRFGGLVYFQHFHECPRHRVSNCIHVVDDCPTERESTRQIASRVSDEFAKKGWTKGIVYMDKAGTAKSSSTGYSDLDEWRAESWKVKWTTNSDAVRVEYGEHLINTLLCSKSGIVSLYFDERLDRRSDKDDRGIVKAIASSVYPEKLSDPNASRAVKDGVIDHIRDALRYPLINLFPPKTRKARTL